MGLLIPDSKMSGDRENCPPFDWSCPGFMDPSTIGAARLLILTDCR